MRQGAAVVCLVLFGAFAAATARADVGLVAKPSGAVAHLVTPIDCAGSSTVASPIASVSPRGGVRKFRPPAGASDGLLASAGQRSAVAWYDRGGVLRSAMVGRGGLTRQVTHSRSMPGQGDVGVTPKGERTMVWAEGPALEVQRVGESGRVGRRFAVGPIDRNESPRIVRQDADGTTWVELSSYDNRTLRVLRIGSDGRVVALNLDRQARDFDDARLERAVPDGRGGLYAVFTADEPYEDPDDDPVRAIVNLTASGQVSYRPFRTTEGLYEDPAAGIAVLLRTRRGLHLVYDNKDGIYLAKVRRDGRLTQSRRLRRTGELRSAAATRNSIVLLIRFSGLRRRRPDGIAVQRFSYSGRKRPAIRVARATPDSDEDFNSLYGAEVVADRSGRVYATWWSERYGDVGAGFVTTIVRDRVFARGRLWRCPMAVEEPEGSEP